MSQTPVRFIHLSDTHFGPLEWSELNGSRPFPRAATVVNAINRIAARDASIDFVVHTGDVATDGDISEYDGASTRLSATVLGKLTKPLIVVNGNHDDLFHLGQHFPAHGTRLCELTGYTPRDHSRSCYFEVGGRQFVTLDARPLPPDPEVDPRGRFIPEEIGALQTLLRNSPKPTSVFLHYPPLELDCSWIDEKMLAAPQPGTPSLHEVLLDSPAQIDGVFFGHIHRAVSHVRDGILYSSAGAVSCHFDALPDATDAAPTDDGIAFFNHVTLNSSGTYVKQLWAPIPR